MRHVLLAVTSILLLFGIDGLPVRAVESDPPGILNLEAAARPLLPPKQRMVVRDRDAEGRTRIVREVRVDALGQIINDGRYREVDASSRLVREGQFANGQRHGDWVMILRSVRGLALFHERPYDQFPGPYYSEATFKNGKLHGVWTIYDAHRRAISEIHFADGGRHGPAVWYYPDGAILRSLHFERGQAHGPFELLGPQGQLMDWGVFEFGRQVDGNAAGGVMVQKSPDQWCESRLAHFELRGAEVRASRRPATAWRPPSASLLGRVVTDSTRQALPNRPLRPTSATPPVVASRRVGARSIEPGTDGTPMGVAPQLPFFGSQLDDPLSDGLMTLPPVSLPSVMEVLEPSLPQGELSSRAPRPGRLDRRRQEFRGPLAPGG